MITDPVGVTNSLCISFLQQRRPELVAGLGVCEDEAAVPCGEVVVDDDVDPTSAAPKLEVEDAGVLDVRRPFLGTVVGHYLTGHKQQTLTEMFE